jgi:outer membrane protein OmpA-like peptidoglycan-associated protein
MFCGYSDTRVWNFIPYLGGGISRNMTQNTYSMGLNFGILNTWRLSKRVMINLDLSLGAHDEDFGAGIATDGNIKRWKLENYDRELNAEVGLTFNLGKATFNKVPDVDAIKALSESQIAALNAQLADANAENARLNNLIKNHKCPEAGKTVTVKEVAAAPVSVFFNLGSAKIASKKDIVNVQALADLAKANDKTIVVTGYADSKTGSANFNQTLSEKRANAVKAELVKMGVAESKIEVKAAGGVNDINPFAYNRRAVVEVK